MTAKIKSCMKYKLTKMKGPLQISLSINNFLSFSFFPSIFCKYKKMKKKKKEYHSRVVI